MAQEHIDFTTPGGDTVTQALHKSEDNFSDLYAQVAAAAATANAAQSQAGVASFKNKLINGNFDFWQRGTSFNLTNLQAATADRWRYNSLGATASAISLQSFPPGQSAVPDNPASFYRSVVTAGAAATDGAVVWQPIENVGLLSGQTVTVSFWAKADANGKKIAVEYNQVFGASGSSTVMAIGVAQATLSTNWQKFSFTTTLPSIAGMTIGAGNCTLLAFWLDAGSNYNARTGSLGHQSGTFDISHVQLEVGSNATPFEQRSLVTERQLCQRYCLLIFPASAFGIFGFGTWGSTTQINLAIPLPVTMRATPTITKNGNLSSLTVNGATSNVSSVAAGGTVQNMVIATCTMASSGTTGNPVQVYCNNDATAYLLLDCEL